MKTMKIIELGNNMISFTIFNEANQVIHKFRRSKKDKQSHIDRIKRIYAKDREIVTIQDETINNI